MVLEVRNLTKSFGAQKAVNNISFALQQGEIVGFLGPNGAGKSTTLKMITGYLPADEGKVLFNNKEVLQHSVWAKRMIGYLSEANPLYYDMYVKEYLSFIASAQQIKNKQARIEEVIELTGLQPEKNKKAGALSKGYKQRLGLAAAIIHDPELLILDEPTTGLDPNQIIEIRNLIKQLGLSKTILFSSHIMQEVKALCDRVIIIHQGSIVANDSLSNLLSNEHQSLEALFRELTMAPLQ